jgi:hypothetical protein
MLIPCSHSQVFVSKQLSYGVNIRACHPEPACGCMPQIVESEIFYARVTGSHHG